jgi:hypothetical protein
LAEVGHVTTLISDMHSAHADRRLHVNSLVEALHALGSAMASSVLPTRMLYAKVRAKLANSTWCLGSDWFRTSGIDFREKNVLSWVTAL